MKNSILLFVAVVTLMFVSCDKRNQPAGPDSPNLTKAYVKAIEGSFVAQDGDVTLKAGIIPVTSRTWTMLARNSGFYGNAPFAPVTGVEFIVGSAAYNFWHNPANNPVTFTPDQAVYSNLTPDENLRVISEGFNAGNKVAYLGIVDFNPSQISFPFVVHNVRLGDVLIVNTNALTALPGSENITITASFSVADVDLAATKAVAVLTTPSTQPSGTTLYWDKIQYGSLHSSPVVTILPHSGDFTVFDSVEAKVMGTITITITETGNGGSVITKTVSAALAGHGLKLTLTTTKIGWYDSGTINIKDNDITIDAVDVLVN